MRAHDLCCDAYHIHDPELLPERVRARFADDGEARAVADYVAGMTDRFAIAEHDRLLGDRS